MPVAFLGMKIDLDHPRELEHLGHSARCFGISSAAMRLLASIPQGALSARTFLFVISFWCFRSSSRRRRPGSLSSCGHRLELKFEDEGALDALIQGTATQLKSLHFRLHVAAASAGTRGSRASEGSREIPCPAAVLGWS